ncbi:MAG: ATP-dependent DNA helicase RecG [Candidatus Aenigmatarchaeota archaeon]
MIELNKPIRFLKGIGPKKEKVFNNLGIYTVKDLLYYFPFRYEDRRNFRKINELNDKEFCAVKGKVLARNLRKIPYFVKNTHIRSIFEIILDDQSASVSCVWFNQPYLIDKIKVGDNLIIYGKPRLKGKVLQFVCPEFEVLSSQDDSNEDSINLGKIVGVYHLASNLTQKFLRKTIFSTYNKFKKELFEPLPFYIRKENNLPIIFKSLEAMHFSNSFEETEKARERFIFEELFFSQILVYLRKAKHRLEKGPNFEIKEDVLNTIRKNLNFSLTTSQEKVLLEILEDLKKPFPMRRLLQGEVGCGKTVISAFLFGVCINSGYQAALMVPTEVLAYQHKETLDEILNGLKCKIEVLVSSLSKKRIKKIKEKLKERNIDIIVGTHSLIQEDVKFNNLGLVVIDEQHKFGVAQRALLPKKGLNPHYLVMSATPIPRSLALSIYGDLDLSVIRELPPKRLKPQTIWVKEHNRKDIYEFLKKKLNEGRQAYIIYPVIEESEKMSLSSIETVYKETQKEFSSFKVGIFHGRLSNLEKLRVIREFRENKINILLATTVLEVGINIENASLMIVENPERFGLAQLHQLRGRIQRSIYQPYFIIISKDKLSSNVLKRLEIIVNNTDGFKIAEEDLKLRGPGDFFGYLQHGLPQLRLANPVKDLEVLKKARFFAYQTIKKDPDLIKPMHKGIRDYISLWFDYKELNYLGD